MRAMLLPSLRFALILMIGAALSSVSFAHQVTKPDAALMAFIEAGGSVDDICGGDGDHAAGHAPCEACRIADAVSDDIAAVHLTADDYGVHRQGPGAAQVAGLPRDPAHPGRAPPFDLS